jgi:DNA-directed RNA polymerase subunit RPC12/RpoP
VPEAVAGNEENNSQGPNFIGPKVLRSQGPKGPSFQRAGTGARAPGRDPRNSRTLGPSDGYDRFVINERDFFTEKPEMRRNSLQCPQCRHRDDYQVKWVRRTKKTEVPRGADARDRTMYDKLRDHLFRVDDYVTCSRCRRRFEIPSHQSMIFLDELPINQEEYDE